VARLDAQRLDEQPGGGRAGVLLLPGKQMSVANGVRFEAAADDEVGVGNLLRFVLDAERLDALADVLVGVLFLGGWRSRSRSSRPRAAARLIA
jgi:hypothetical protein